MTDKLEINTIELRKLKECYQRNKEDKRLQWLLFIDDPNLKEVQEIMKKNEEVKDAVVEIHKMTQDEKIKRLADLREKAIMDEQLIKKAGYKQGEKTSIIKMIKSIIKQNIDINTISKITDLSIDEIKEYSK